MLLSKFSMLAGHLVWDITVIIINNNSFFLKHQFRYEMHLNESNFDSWMNEFLILFDQVFNFSLCLYCRFVPSTLRCWMKRSARDFVRTWQGPWKVPSSSSRNAWWVIYRIDSLQAPQPITLLPFMLLCFYYAVMFLSI